MSRSPTVLVTGFPGFIGKRLVRHIARSSPGVRLLLLVQAPLLEEAAAEVGRLGTTKVELLVGDIADMHLGLAGTEYEGLCTTCTHIFHLAAAVALGGSRESAWRVNVDGTRNVIELARDCRDLQRLVHFSTIAVSGDRLGVVAEDELVAGQGFRNVYEESKYEAEKLMQKAKSALPITIVRPGTVVGDSRTGEIDRFDGPYALGMLLVFSPLVMPLPLPGNGLAPLNVVPVDYVVEATWALSALPQAAGKTVHLVDPHPMSARRVYEHLAQRTNRRLPRFNVSARAADWVLRLPGFEKLAGPQRAALSSVNHLAFYTSRTACELLELDGSGIRCPALTEYVDRLVDFAVEASKRRRSDLEVEVDDPLDAPVGEAGR